MIGEPPLVLCMVGLPARGKSYIARKIVQYVGWLGREAQVFNVGSYRRETLGAGQPAAFFDPSNPDGAAARGLVAEAALADLVRWVVERPGRLAVYDATNVGRSRRARVRAACEAAGAQVVFVESVCDDPAVVEANIRLTKLRSPDYAGVTEERAVEDFRARIDHYASAWEPVDARDGSFVRLVDVGRRLEVHEVGGWLLGRLVYLLMNLHIAPRSMWFTRHGESTHNALGRIGGDADLTPRGVAFAAELGRYLPSQIGPEALVWTSTLIRTQRTAEGLPWPSTPLRALDEIDAGTCDGMTYDDIETQLPDEYAARATDKLRYRYPRGESYEDVINRLDPVILELERQRTPVVVVAHQAVLRALIAYFKGIPRAECPHLSVPLHTVIRLTPNAYGCDEWRVPLHR